MRKRQRRRAKRGARPPGRPPKPPGEKWSECVMVRMTPVERERIQAEAKRRGISLSALLMLQWREEA